MYKIEVLTDLVLVPKSASVSGSLSMLSFTRLGQIVSNSCATKPI